MSQTFAELCKSLIMELRPEWNVQVVEQDYNLYKLGFVDEVPCSLEMDVTIEKIEELYDAIIDMEISVYLHEDLLLKSPYDLTKEEKELQKQLKFQEKEYYRFASLEGLCLDILNNEEL